MTKTKSLIPMSLKTDKFGPLVFRTTDRVTHFYQYYSAMPDMGDVRQNLHFVEDGSIKEADYVTDGECVGKVLFSDSEGYSVEIGAGTSVGDFDYHTLQDEWQKIVATTCANLIKKGIPAIPEMFVKHYCYKNGDINYVDIEMDSIYVEPVGIHSNRGDFIEIPKLKKNDIGEMEVVIYHEPAPVVDWDSFTMTQFIEHLEEEIKFSSIGTSKAVIELINAYKEMKEGLKSVRKEYAENVNEEDSITEKLDKLIGDE